MASLIPENTAPFSWQDLVRATGGECARFDGLTRGVWTDSRAIRPGGVFVALQGETFDGHAFVGAAVERGARVVVVERPVAEVGSAAVLRVPSALGALGSLARFHRRRWGKRVVAVAGSVGKTTTRTATAAVLGAAGQVVHSPRGNLNNLIGVPMVLLGLEERHTTAVLELGTSVSGEIERLMSIAEPDAALLTRITLEHCQGLGDLDAIEREEGAALGLLRSEGVAITNVDDPRCRARLAAAGARRRLGYGIGRDALETQVDYRVLRHEALSALRTRVALERPRAAALDVESPLLGLPGAYALAAAVALTEALLERSLDQSEVDAALRSPELGEPGRLTPVTLDDGTLVLDDTYNSSPASVLSSVAVARELADQRGGRLLLLLGEMRELGELSRAAHREVGEGLVSARPDLVIAFAGDAEVFLDGPREAGLATGFAADAAAALPIVAAARRPGDVILVKASRSLGAERIVAALARLAAKGTPA